jgi:hypothetical protein
LVFLVLVLVLVVVLDFRRRLFEDEDDDEDENENEQDEVTRTISMSPSPLKLTDFIRSIPDFPKPGILFRDITPLLRSPAAFREAIVQMASPYRGMPIDVIAAAEARGFIFAAPLALELGAGFVPVRKPGNCWWTTSWPPRARWKRAASWWRSAGPRSSAAPF